MHSPELRAASPARVAPRPTERGGVMLAAAGGLVLSLDVPALRLGGGDLWSVMALRATLVGGVGLLAWAIMRWLGKAGPLIPGRMGFVVAALYAFNSVTFVAAIFLTTTANVVFIIALNPLLAALFAWLIAGERPHAVTLGAAATTVIGVGLIVFDGMSVGGVAGELCALATAVTLALCLVLTRKHDLAIGYATLVASLVPGLIALAYVSATTYAIAAPGWIVLDGAVIMPIAFFCLSVAPRYVPGPVVAMAFLLETCLAPVWVWLIFGEQPGRYGLAGGSIVLAAVCLHGAWQWRVAAPRATPASSARPIRSGAE